MIHGVIIKYLEKIIFRFPTDKEVIGIDEQFLLGSSFLVSPVLQPVILNFYISIIILNNKVNFKGHKTVNAYFPKARWYEYRTASFLNEFVNF